MTDDNSENRQKLNDALDQVVTNRTVDSLAQDPWSRAVPEPSTHDFAGEHVANEEAREAQRQEHNARRAKSGKN